jgi:uncharacterized RDD family membrane protein YckC
MPYRPPPPPLSPGGQPLASFGDRFLAFLLDSVILYGVFYALLFIPAFIVFIANADFPTQPDPNTGVAPFPTRFFVTLLIVDATLFVLLIVAAYVYSVEMMYRTGQTIGKRVMKIRVVCADPAVELTRGIAVQRWFIEYVAGALVPFLNLLDGLWQLWDKPYQQCLHDKFAQTVVVKVTV